MAKSRSSIVAPYLDIITAWLEEDQKHWSKQHHTAKRIHERLKDEYGFTGSYDSVQKFVQKLRKDIQTKGTQELIWEPGCAQVDFGEADFNEDTDCVRRKYLTVSFPYSNDGYSQVFRGETAECVCQGLMDVFNYIGGVPKLLVFDNATGVGRRVMDKIHETELFSRFRAHYIDILEPNGELLVLHMRQYGDRRTDFSDYSTSLEMLSKNIGAWDNSGFRKDAPELIREYIDNQSRVERKSCVRLLSDLTKEYGYDAAIGALELAIKAGNVNKSDTAILAARITGYGIDTPPEPGPSLAIYDQVFLPSKDAGKEAIAS